jgi:hypothetical protein
VARIGPEDQPIVPPIVLPTIDLRYRTQLCKHGKDHGPLDPDCSYAHSLCDLRLASPELQDY